MAKKYEIAKTSKEQNSKEGKQVSNKKWNERQEEGGTPAGRKAKKSS